MEATVVPGGGEDVWEVEATVVPGGGEDMWKVEATVVPGVAVVAVLRVCPA